MTRKGFNRFHSIRYKFIGIQFFSILLTVLLVCGFSLHMLSDYYAESQKTRLEAHAQSFSIEADQLLKHLSGLLKNLDTFEYHQRQNLGVLINSFTENMDDFPKLLYFEERGQPVVKVVEGRAETDDFTPLNEQLLVRALSNPNQVLLTVVEHDPDFASAALLFTQARVGYFGDEFQGVVQAVVPVTEFAEMFSDRHLHEGIELVLVDQQGRIMLHSQPERIFQSIFPRSAGWISQLAEPVDDHVAIGERSFDGEFSYYSYRYLNSSGWYAFAIIPISQFDLLLQKLIKANIYLALFGLLAGSLLAHFMGRPILKNIGRIKLQTQNLAEGRLEERVVVDSSDELSDLAESVNKLTEKLRFASAAYDSVDLMLQTVVDPLIICDAHGTIFKTNSASQELFGVTAEDFGGQSLSRYFSQRSPLAARERLLEMLQQPQLRNYETEIQVAGGNVIPVNFSFAHGYEGSGEVRFIVCLFKDISLQKKAETEIAQLAYFDSLTGLPNRSLLHDRLNMTIRHAERSQGEHKRFAVMFLDLDHFKNVNDTLGHSIGDLLLQSAAKRLKNCLRQADTVGRVAAESDGSYEGEEHVLARLGGDEFIILLPLLRSPEDAGVVARQIIDDMGKPFLLQGHEVVTPASIGLAIYPDDGSDSETLMRCADVAMYHAKEQGRNSFYFYSEEMNEAARERLELEHHLRHDIEHKQGFYLVYQPKVDTENKRMVGIEALARWSHPELGEVPPVRFIPIAEDSGLIVPLGKWILEMACQQLQCWIQEGRPHCKMAVNLSGRQLRQPDLLPMVAGVLLESGLNPELLEFELTESMLMETAERSILLMGQLRQIGISLSIDDFGTGYSSLSYLKRFPIDTLKIDRSFVRDIESDSEDAAIIEAIIAMARSLKLEVVAEGVETEMQLDFLREKGTHQCQGFLFGKPVPADLFVERYL